MGEGLYLAHLDDLHGVALPAVCRYHFDGGVVTQ